MPARRKAANPVKCLPKRPLTYREGTTNSRNVERFFHFRED
jgi:hypothetical protein